MRSFIEILSTEVAQLLLPLKEKIRDIGSFIGFLNELGWDWPMEYSINQFTENFSELNSSILTLSVELGNIDPETSFEGQVDKYYKLIESIKNLIPAILHLENILASFPASVNSANFNDKIGSQILDFLFCNYLERRWPQFYNLILFFGIVNEIDLDFNKIAGYSKRYNINWESISKPFQTFKDNFNWNHPTNDFDILAFLKGIESICLSIGIPVNRLNLSPQFKNSFYENTEEAEDTTDSLGEKLELKIPIVEISDPGIGFTETGFSLFGIPANNSAINKINGFAIAPYLSGNLDLLFKLNKNLYLKISGKLDTGFAITILPDEVNVRTNLYRSERAFDGNFCVEIFNNSDVEEIILIGEPNKSRFSYKNFHAKLDFLTIDAGFDLLLEIAINNILINIQKGDGDGFIQQILPKDPVTLNFDLTLGISLQRGFYIIGGAGLSYTISVQKAIGPFFIDSIDLSLEARDKITFLTAVSGSASIGPATVVVKDIGLEVCLDTGKPGLLGNTDLTFGFKPPSALGFEFDAQGVEGGGYLDSQNGNYFGSFYLEVQKKISVYVFGILLTKTETGDKTFALKFFGFAEFPAIQVGFGFAITGLGLVIAINCCMSDDALRNAIYNGNIRSLLFPPDPIANAVKIINDLNSFFPQKENSYVIGASIIVFWGGVTPLIKLDIGLFIEINRGVRIGLAGIASATLPNEIAPLVVINFQVLGIIDFNNKTLSIDASLFDSRILDFTLDGDIALRSKFGKSFALSAGGFYPGYAPPEGFPSLQRLSLSLGNIPRLNFLLYTAITESSVQFGADLNLHFEAGCFEINGGFSFNALFIFIPSFSFKVGMRAYMDLKMDGDTLFGIDLKFTLTGPNNYTATGYAEFDILWFSFSIDFDAEFGNKKPELPPVSLSSFDALTAEIKRKENWSILPPIWGSDRILFRKDNDTNNYLDPFGSLQFFQLAVPLKITMQKFGNAPPKAGEEYLDIILDTNFAVNDIKKELPVHDFFDLTQEQEISGPAYVPYTVGFCTSSKAILVPDKNERITASYETRYPNETEYIPGVRFDFFDKYQKVTGKKLYNKFKVKSESQLNNQISINDQMFTVVIPEAADGKFKRAGYAFNGKKSPNLNYSQAKQVKEDIGGEVKIMNTAKAESIIN
jgi:hypothetical protein